MPPKGPKPRGLKTLPLGPLLGPLHSSENVFEWISIRGKRQIFMCFERCRGIFTLDVPYDSPLNVGTLNSVNLSDQTTIILTEITRCVVYVMPPFISRSYSMNYKTKLYQRKCWAPLPTWAPFGLIATTFYFTVNWADTCWVIKYMIREPP